MMRRTFLVLSLLITLSSISAGLFGSVSAQVRQSTSYQIQSDSVNFGGGLSTSSNFSQESTFGELATGIGTSSSYNLYAGYQQMQEVSIAITGGANVTMSPAIGGVTGGTSTGSFAVTVTTDSPGGYDLQIEAANSPAMQGPAPATIADYDPGSVPDFAFTTTATDAHFGFTPSGSHIVGRFLDNGAVCNTGSGDTTNACWEGLSTTATSAAMSTDANHPAGTETTFTFQVGIGSQVNQAPGVYVATTTVTAIAL